MKSRLLILCMLLVGAGASAQTNTFEQYRRNQRQAFDQIKSRSQAEFDRYRREQNEAFSKAMEATWKSYYGEEQAPPKEEEPVLPIDTTTYQKLPTVTQPISTQPIAVKPVVIVIPTPQPEPEPIAPIVPEKKEQQQAETCTTKMYGTPMTMQFPQGEKFHIRSLDEKALAKVWNQISEKRYDIIVSSALAMREKYALCDWAYLQAVKALTEKYYGESNEATFMQVYILTQSGYLVRLGATDRQLVLLLASDYTIFNMSYFRVDGVRYYTPFSRIRDLRICAAMMKKPQKFCMQIRKQPLWSERNSTTRTLTGKKPLSAAVCVNLNNIDFYDSYPRAGIGDETSAWISYANTPMEAAIQKQLYPVLRKACRDLNERDAVGLLLNWVQTAFAYEYDDKVWGGDRVFFPSETLYYPYCDCEDRAILFSRLVRDILNKDVVLLYYPGHLAAAVAFDGEVNGDYLTYDQRRYTVCDPTYIGAGVGRTMPGMNNKQAQVIVLKK